MEEKAACLFILSLNDFVTSFRLKPGTAYSETTIFNQGKNQSFQEPLDNWTDKKLFSMQKA